jgi:hypothetical protein
MVERAVLRTESLHRYFTGTGTVHAVHSTPESDQPHPKVFCTSLCNLPRAQYMYVDIEDTDNLHCRYINRRLTYGTRPVSTPYSVE